MASTPLVSRKGEHGRDSGAPDCFFTKHSAGSNWESPKTADEVSADLVRIINGMKPPAVTPKRHPPNWTSVVTKQEPNVVWSQRITGKAGFTDLQTFTLTPSASGSGTHISAFSKARDVHCWSAVCPCLGNQCGLWVSWLWCCCGICPTLDWGANKAFLDQIKAEAGLVDAQPK